MDEMAFHKMCNVTHLLLVIGHDVLRLAFTKCPMSLTICWSQETQHFNKYAMSRTSCRCRKGCEETAFHKMCDVTHFLLIIGKGVMRLPFTKCAMSLTFCSYEKM